MMTVVTTSTLRPGGEAEWDAAMRARFDAARERHQRSRAELPPVVQSMSRGEPVIPTVFEGEQY